MSNEAAARVSAAIEYQRDYYVCTAAEMRERWLTTTDQRKTATHIRPALPDYMKLAHDSAYAEHNPLWEFIRCFQYGAALDASNSMAWEFDEETQKRRRMDEFYLEHDLHKVRMCDPILDYLIEPQAPTVRGLGVFVMRDGLKTRIFVIGTGAFLLARHRILFNNYVGIRVIHDVESEAQKRIRWIKDLFVYNSALRALYPELAIPSEIEWGTKGEWDMPGCDVAGRSGDPQVAAFGARSRIQGTHYPITLIDDMESPDSESSVASRAQVERYFHLLKFSGKGQWAKTLLAGTFYSPFGVHAIIAESAADEKRTTKWLVTHLPAIVDEGLATERSAYPKRFSLEFLKAESQAEVEDTGDDMRFRMQRMLDFKASGKYHFDLERNFTLDLDKLKPGLQEDIAAELPSAPCVVYSDLAGKREDTKGQGDWSAILVVKYPRVEGRIHSVVVDAAYTRELTLDEGCAAQLDMANSYAAWLIVGEENPSHHVVGAALDRLAKERGYNYRQRILPNGKVVGNIITLKPRGTSATSIGTISTWKMGRMLKLRSKWNAGLIWLLPELAGSDDFKRCLMTFPFTQQDDWLDALSQGEEDEIQGLLPDPAMKATPLHRRRGRKRETLTLGRYTGYTVKR